MKRGEMKLSFGMIFSIILIIIFISFAFYAIGKFLEIRDVAQVAKFADDLQSDVNRIWRSSLAEQELKYFLPSKIKYVCFMDYLLNEKGNYGNFYTEFGRVFNENENLFFYPIGSAQGLDSKEIKNIDIEKTTAEENPLCFENIKGKVTLTIKKNFDENLVTIGK